MVVRKNSYTGREESLRSRGELAAGIWRRVRGGAAGPGRMPGGAGDQINEACTPRRWMLPLIHTAHCARQPHLPCSTVLPTYSPFGATSRALLHHSTKPFQLWHWLHEGGLRDGVPHSQDVPDGWTAGADDATPATAAANTARLTAATATTAAPSREASVTRQTVSAGETRTASPSEAETIIVIAHLPQSWVPHSKTNCPVSGSAAVKPADEAALTAQTETEENVSPQSNIKTT